MAGGLDYPGWRKKALYPHLYGAPVASGGDLASYTAWYRWLWAIPAPWLLVSDVHYTLNVVARDYTVVAVARDYTVKEIA